MSEHFTPAPKPIPAPAKRKQFGSTLAAPTEPLNARNAKRAKANHARAYGEKRDWIVTLPCAICGWRAPSDPAHAKTDGKGRKAGARWLFPACPPHWETRNVFVEGCHREQHRIGVKSFEAKHGVSLVGLADAFEARWQAHRAGQA